MSKIDLHKGDYIELVNKVYFMRIDTGITNDIGVTLYEIVACEVDNSPYKVKEIGNAYVKYNGSIHMWLGDKDRYSYIDNIYAYNEMIKSFSQICLNLVCTDSEYIDNTIKIKRQTFDADLKNFVNCCRREKEAKKECKMTRAELNVKYELLALNEHWRMAISLLWEYIEDLDDR